jgi:hypothetical protein
MLLDANKVKIQDMWAGQSHKFSHGLKHAQRDKDKAHKQPAHTALFSRMCVQIEQLSISEAGITDSLKI